MAPVCPDHEICRFSRRHQVRFAHDSAHLRPPGKVKLLTERSVDIEGRGRKAVSGNYCSIATAFVFTEEKWRTTFGTFNPIKPSHRTHILLSFSLKGLECVKWGAISCDVHLFQ